MRTLLAINVPAGATVPLGVDFSAYDGAAGGWMYHCHILEHAEGGMMGEVTVAP
jgi:FtsP/CotA-like multicopper oxidase with cupredoxin domain